MDYGTDPSVQAAAEKLLGRFTGQAPEEPKKRAPELRDPANEPTQEELDADEDAYVNGYEPDEELPEGADAQGADAEGDEAQGSQDEYFELPAETEGAEAEKIPRAEAIAAVRQMRQLNGGIAEAITKAETEHFAKQDQAWTSMVQAHNAVIERAEAALASIPRPQMPPDVLLDEGSQYYNPNRYYALKTQYEDQVALLQGIKQRKDAEERARAETIQQAQGEHFAREHERVSRFLPDWKDEAKRDDMRKGIYEFLGKAYGLDANFLDTRVPFDHRIMRAITDLKSLKEAQTKAPEVRKSVQEQAPKLNAKGRIPSQDRDPANGQFVNQAKKRLKSEGSEAAAAAKWLAEGRIRL